MNKLFLASAITASLLFSGCAKSTAFDFFSTNTYYENAIGNMEKASLTSDSETKALVQGIYLNKVDPIIYSGDEYFFIAVHIIDDEQDSEMQGLSNLKYNLQLVEKVKVVEDDETKKPEFDTSGKSDKNKKKPKTKLVYIDQIESMELNDPTTRLRESMPIKSRWNHYYLVRYKEVNTPTITLTYENEKYGKVDMVFQKEEVLKKSKSIFKGISSQQSNY